VKQARDAIRAMSKSVRKRLEGVSQLDAEEIKKQLREEVLLECQDEIRALRRETLEKSEQEIQTQSRRILIASMQRLAKQARTRNLTATLVHLPTEEMKGRIIGREGRNIKSVRGGDGVTLLIDESPQLYLLSSFDPVRREIAAHGAGGARQGRPHPPGEHRGVRQARRGGDRHRHNPGGARRRSQAQHQRPALRDHQAAGRLKYRSPTTRTCSITRWRRPTWRRCWPARSGLDPNVAKRAGLLHDIGKAAPGELEGAMRPSARISFKRFGETPIVVNAVAAHHEEVKPETIYSGLVILADTISATRPGARAESMSSYIQRLGRLEKLALSSRASSRRFAIQAGREIRVVVSPQEVDRRSRAGDRQGAPDPHRGRAAVSEHDQITVIREARFRRPHRRTKSTTTFHAGSKDSPGLFSQPCPPARLLIEHRITSSRRSAR